MIPNYCYSTFPDQCIQSVLNQTYKNIEIFVLDNCSNGNSLDITKKYIKDVVRLFSNPINIFNRSFNIITDLAAGKYKMLLCSDDYLLPQFIEKSVSIMEDYPNIGYVHAERDNKNENGDIISLYPFYNCSFYVKCEEVMPIYFMTPVACLS